MSVYQDFHSAIIHVGLVGIASLSTTPRRTSPSVVLDCSWTASSIVCEQAQSSDQFVIVIIRFCGGYGGVKDGNGATPAQGTCLADTTWRLRGKTSMHAESWYLLANKCKR